MIRKALILAGGDGARPDANPMAALSAEGEPLAHYTLWNLARHGITDVFISGTGAAQTLGPILSAHPVPGVSVHFCAECTASPDDLVLVVDGYRFFDVNYLDLAMRAERGAAVALRCTDDLSGGTRVELANGVVREIRKVDEASPGLALEGVCCLTGDMVAGLSLDMAALERDLLPRLAGEGRLAGCVYPGEFFDLKDDEAPAALPAWKRKPALFLDRDGVLNVDHGYVHSREEWTWCPGAREAVKYANDAGLLVVLITNQSGIGRGYYGEDAFYGLMDWVRQDLAGVGAHLDAVYHCPHHPTEGIGEYRRECTCRKPKPGMMQRALDEWPVDVGRSAVIGDSERDLEAGRQVGINRLRLYDHEQESLLDVVRDVFSFLSDE